VASLTEQRRALPRVAVIVGAPFPLVVPWGFWRTGGELWALARAAGPDAAGPDESFLAIYVDVLWACRFLLLAVAISSAGRLLIAWGAVRLGSSTRAHG
jgi:hypothetical protein